MPPATAGERRREAARHAAGYLQGHRSRLLASSLARWLLDAVTAHGHGARARQEEHAFRVCACVLGGRDERGVGGRVVLMASGAAAARGWSGNLRRREPGRRRVLAGNPVGGWRGVADSFSASCGCRLLVA
jgi:hypothetical protein